MAFRHLRWPRALTWMGLISYSLYLLHPLVIEVYHHFYPSRQHTFAVQVLIAAGLVAVMIAVSSVTYLFVERPAQGLGRRVGGWLDIRFGPDQIPARRPRGSRPWPGAVTRLPSSPPRTACWCHGSSTGG